MVDQANYDTYTPLRIDQMPVVEVHIVAFGRRAHGRWRAGRPADRPGAGERRLSGDEKAGADAAIRQGIDGVAK